MKVMSSDLVSMKLIDIRNEFQGFGGNGYVPDLVHGANIHLCPFPPIVYAGFKCAITSIGTKLLSSSFSLKPSGLS